MTTMTLDAARAQSTYRRESLHRSFGTRPSRAHRDGHHLARLGRLVTRHDADHG